jgi:hypothetical protein
MVAYHFQAICVTLFLFLFGYFASLNGRLPSRRNTTEFSDAWHDTFRTAFQDFVAAKGGDSPNRF